MPHPAALTHFHKKETDDEDNLNRGNPGRHGRLGRVLANRGATSFDKYERRGHTLNDRP